MNKTPTKADLPRLTSRELDTLMLNLTDEKPQPQLLKDVIVEQRSRIECDEKAFKEKSLTAQLSQLQSLQKTSEELLRKFDKIITLLYTITEHPKRSYWYAIVFAVITGTLIALLTTGLTNVAQWSWSFLNN